MNNQSEKKSIKEVVLDKIKKNEAKMRPKLYFVLKAILLIMGILILFALGVYLTSFILFTLRISGLWFMPEFGFQGMRILFGNFPWLLILVTLFFIVLLEILIKQYSISYRKPIIYSALTIIVLIIITSFMVQKSPFHRRIFERSQMRPLPIIGPIYNRYGARRPDNVYPGIISEITKDGFIMKQPDRTLIKVIISDITRFPREGEIQNIKKGDYVVVMGKIKDGIIQAEGLHKSPNGEEIPPNFHPDRPL